MARIFCNIIVPLTFAILLNELCLKKMKRPIQTIVYMPHFLSWVILAKIVLNIFGYTGPINQILGFFGQSPVQFFGEPSLFRPLVIGTDVWKSFGYNTVIYLAAILGIDPTLYEAAAVDGAGRFRRIWHITLPGIRMTVALLAILALGNVLNAGFDRFITCIIRSYILPVILLIPGFTDMVFRTCSFHLQLRLVCLNLLSA